MTADVFEVPWQGMQQYHMFIDGRWVDAASRATFASVNPFTGQPWAVFPRADATDVERAVTSAARAFEQEWAHASAKERADRLRALGALLADEGNATRLAITEVVDNGKVIREVLGQMKALSDYSYYYAGLAESTQGETIPVPARDTINFTLREPLGVVAAVTPWNSPLLLTFMKIAPALAAGNTIVVKPSEFTPASLLEFARLVERAEIPAGVINIVTGYGDVGEALVAHPQVAKVAFTGSTTTGRHIMRGASETLKRVTLELGGKSPNIIFDDADVSNAVNGVVAGIFAAAGQSCMAGSRVLIQSSIYDAVAERLVARAQEIKVGNPLSLSTEMGTIANRQQYERILEYIDIGVDEGAKLLYGGSRPALEVADDALFIEPTIFGDVRNDMRIAQEEIFGPVVCLIPFADEDEAVKLANETQFGLAAAVWTSNIQRALRVVRLLQAGTVWVNNYRKVAYSSPFGGYKASGLGRENGIESMREYTQIKSVWLDYGNVITDPFRIL